MILSRLMGGLGNQMFQYAFGRMLAEKYATELVLDLSFLHDRSQPDHIATHRSFELDAFALSTYRLATDEEVVFYNGVPNGTIAQRIAYRYRRLTGKAKVLAQYKNVYLPSHLDPGNNTCIAGRWQSENYFKDIGSGIRKEFRLKTALPSAVVHLGEEMRSCNSVAVHVRRGDLVTSPLYSKTIGVLPVSYYTAGIAQISKLSGDARVFVFSDDPDWCKKHLPYELVEPALALDKGLGHFYLMQQCRHQVISNSTFSWWAAWLNEHPGKQVVGPLGWYRDPSLMNTVIFPKGWITL